jgi:alkylation response protein AidB-like acyl-CoA dehydrogenase
VAIAENRWVVWTRRLADNVLTPHAADVDRVARWPAESIAGLADLGLLGLTVPGTFGGAGEGARTFAAVTQILAERCASTAMIYLMHVCAMQVVAAAEGFPQREAILRQAAAGRHLSTLAFSERGSRSHFWAPVSRAVHEGEMDRLTADKSFVTSAGYADSYVVSAGSVGASEAMASTLYHVPWKTAGFSVSGRWEGLGLRGNASAPMRLDNVGVPAAHRLSGVGAGFGVMMSTVLPWFQLGSAAVSVGISRAATAGLREHLRATRMEHLDQPLASFPNLRARLARMQLLTDTQQAFLLDVAGRVEAGAPEAMMAILQVKAAAAEAALEVTDLAMRAGGGAAFGRGLSLERNFRDARAAWVMAPTTDVLHDLIGRTLLDMPLF